LVEVVVAQTKVLELMVAQAAVGVDLVLHKVLVTLVELVQLVHLDKVIMVVLLQFVLSLEEHL
jgi:hypothetical protein